MILLTNLVLLAMGLNGQWDVSQYIVVYWIETVLIGLFTLLKLLIVQSRSPMPLLMSRGSREVRSIDVNASAPWRLAIVGFFLVAFSVAMVVSLIFLFVALRPDEMGAGHLDIRVLPSIFWGVVFVFIAQTFSFLYYFVLRGGRTHQPINLIFFIPFPRLLFLILIAVIAIFLSLWPPLVVALKLVADWMAYRITISSEENTAGAPTSGL